MAAWRWPEPPASASSQHPAQPVERLSELVGIVRDADTDVAFVVGVPARTERHARRDADVRSVEQSLGEFETVGDAVDRDVAVEAARRRRPSQPLVARDEVGELRAVAPAALELQRDECIALLDRRDRARLRET